MRENPQEKLTDVVLGLCLQKPGKIEYHLQCLRSIQLRHDSGMSKEDMARATGHSLAMVQQYLNSTSWRISVFHPYITSGGDGVQSSQA
jgi:hypothetical protein